MDLEYPRMLGTQTTSMYGCTRNTVHGARAGSHGGSQDRTIAAEDSVYSRMASLMLLGVDGAKSLILYLYYQHYLFE